jgi:hypothetical protein
VERYIKEAIHVAELVGFAEGDGSTKDEIEELLAGVSNVMKAGNLTRADITKALDAHKAKVESVLDEVNI